MSNGSKTNKGQFEIEREGQISFLTYSIDGKRIKLLHTEVPRPLRGHGIAAELAKMSLEYAKANDLKVEILCPVVSHFLAEHPEYKPLIHAPSSHGAAPSIDQSPPAPDLFDR